MERIGVSLPQLEEDAKGVSVDDRQAGVFLTPVFPSVFAANLSLAPFCHSFLAMPAKEALKR